MGATQKQVTCLHIAARRAPNPSTSRLLWLIEAATDVDQGQWQQHRLTRHSKVFVLHHACPQFSKL